MSRLYRSWEITALAVAVILAAITPYVGHLAAALLLLGALTTLFYVVGRRPTNTSQQRRLRRGVFATLAILTIGLEMLPGRILWEQYRGARSTDMRSEQKPTVVRWSDRLSNGEKLIVELGDELPAHARGALFLEGQSYAIRFRGDSCEWESSGPIKHPAAGVIERHVNKAGPAIKPYLGVEDSGTVTAECNSPRDSKLVVAGTPVDFDWRGYVSFGGASIAHRIGRLRVANLN